LKATSLNHLHNAPHLCAYLVVRLIAKLDVGALEQLLDQEKQTADHQHHKLRHYLHNQKNDRRIEDHFGCPSFPETAQKRMAHCELQNPNREL
jgi:hypothetical protein